MSRNPRTEAGRALLDWIAERLPDSGPRQITAILAIEDEAAATERRLTVERVRRYLLDADREMAGLTPGDINSILDDLATADVDDRLAGGANNGPVWQNEPKDGWKP